MSSYLLPLPVLGAGTKETESFASYFSRMAFFHGLGRVQLRRMLIGRSKGGDGEAQRSETVLYGRKAGVGIYGFSRRVRELVALTEEAAQRRNLLRTTLVPIGPATSSRFGIRPSRQWCDLCFTEDLLEDVCVHDRLIWTLAPVTRCEIHRIQLRSTCPGCGRLQTVHHKVGDPGICFRCGQSLIGAVSDRKVSLHGDSAEHQCRSLVAAISVGELDNVPKNAFGTFVRCVAEEVAPVGRRVLNLAASHVLRRREMQYSNPSLLVAIDVAEKTGVLVSEILADPVGASRLAGQTLFDVHGIPNSLRVSLKQRQLELREFMEQALAEKAEELPSARELRIKFSLDKTSIYELFPRLATQYRNRRKSLVARKRYRYVPTARKEILILAERGEIQKCSTKNLAAHLVETAGCPIEAAMQLARNYHKTRWFKFHMRVRAGVKVRRRRLL